MDADERLLEAVSQFLTSYHINSVEDVNSLVRFLESQGVFSLADIEKHTNN